MKGDAGVGVEVGCVWGFPFFSSKLRPRKVQPLLLQMGKLRPREEKGLVQGHIANGRD